MAEAVDFIGPLFATALGVPAFMQPDGWALPADYELRATYRGLAGECILADRVCAIDDAAWRCAELTEAWRGG